MIRPLKAKLVLQRIEGERESEAGILLATAKKTNLARVVAVGPDVVGIERNATVILSEYGPTELSYDGDTYLVCSDDDVVGVAE